jgi:glycosyltransferase involved in cell wall biosynthesis
MLHEKQRHGDVIIGWTGSHSTLKYLQDLEAVLLDIEKAYPEVTFWVISDGKPGLSLPRLVFRPWSVETEIADLRQFDIGIMPLPDDLWANGKCGFKALQYLALGIPAVVSPIGVNKFIVEPGVEGFLALNPNEWRGALVRLIEDPDLRNSFGHNGRAKVVQHYSVISRASTFLRLFEKFNINSIPTK